MSELLHELDVSVEPGVSYLPLYTESNLCDKFHNAMQNAYLSAI